ncbi:MAG: recombinase family protein, partial [Geminicoccaceae bacterium]
MAFRLHQHEPASPSRVALYLRVSTGRQAAGEVSIPSQRDLTRRYCEARGWVVTEEYIEPGASATDDRRPVFQRMLEAAREPDRRFDVIVVHAYSRFYRNGAEMELTIRSLRKLGVEVVSVTQPTGDDPSQELMRQIIGIFDEYTSRENGKNVTRAMRESARQGFWNGSTPPLGYRVVEAERRGAKIKKKLEVDPVEAETVRLIFRLYLEGDGTSGPLGVKETTTWLNGHGYRTRVGAHFGVGPLHRILKNACYATGRWRYGVHNSRTGGLHDPSTVVEIDVPTILPMPVFERVQERLSLNRPTVTPPRIVNGPTLLAGLAICGCCGAGMTRTATRRRDRLYAYYSCGGRHQKGRAVCGGRHIPMARLDDLVVDNVRQHLFSDDRLAEVLGALIERQGAKDKTSQDRMAALEAEIAGHDDRLKRLYRAIEEGVIELDQDLKARIQTLKQLRDIATTALDRTKIQLRTVAAVTPARLEAFSRIMRERLQTADVRARQAYLRSVVAQIEVGQDRIRIYSDRDALAAAASGNASGVRGFVRKWRARKDSNARPGSGRSPRRRRLPNVCSISSVQSAWPHAVFSDSSPWPIPAATRKHRHFHARVTLKCAASCSSRSSLMVLVSFDRGACDAQSGAFTGAFRSRGARRLRRGEL